MINVGAAFVILSKTARTQSWRQHCKQIQTSAGACRRFWPAGRHRRAKAKHRYIITTKHSGHSKCRNPGRMAPHQRSALHPWLNLVISLNEGPQYRPQNTVVLIIATPKMVPPIMGNPHLVAKATHRLLAPARGQR